MSKTELILLILVFFLTSFVGVVTGSNSLITVPAMFQLGVDPRVAIATNMFGLTFMNIGASLPFIKQGTIVYKRLLPLILITLAASSVGALLVGIINTPLIPVIVSIAMVAVVIFILFERNLRPVREGNVANQAKYITFALAFFLGIYGGLYSGGYVTILTTVLVAFFGLSFTEAIAGTKFINIFSSGIATVIFAWQGLIDYRLGIILAVTMFVAAFLGAQFVTKMNEKWLRRIFLATVLLLAIKTFFDFAL